MQNKTRTAMIITYVKDSPDIDPTHTLAALGDSETLYEKMFVQMIRLIPTWIKQMDAYIATGDIKAFGIVAHGLKGSLRQAGCERLAHLAGLLEKEAKEANLPFCHEQYTLFKDSLHSLYEQADAVIQRAIAEESREIKTYAFINEYTDALTRVKATVEDYDSLLAAELLEPLSGQCFGGRIDRLIALAMDALNTYRPEAALQHINELITTIEET